MADEPAQRRLSAIVSADIVGDGRLMEFDETDTLAALKVRRRDVLGRRSPSLLSPLADRELVTQSGSDGSLGRCFPNRYVC